MKSVNTYYSEKGTTYGCPNISNEHAAAGFFKYNGMNFEEFVIAYVRSEFLCAGVRTYKSENFLYDAYKEMLKAVSVRKKKCRGSKNVL